MRWPTDHPALTDERLAPWRHGAAELCGDAEIGPVLRYLPGRRVATAVRLPAPCGQGEPAAAVLKVFASPRARGNQRRLAVLAGSPAAEVVPAPLGCDRAGHVSLVRWTPGVVLEALADRAFVAACRGAGDALRRLHAAPPTLDRYWTWHDEIEALMARATPATLPLAEAVARRTGHVAGEALVTAHRDCHPRQLIVEPAGPVRWIDLDDCALAPAGLDAGNFVAHLRRAGLLGQRPRAVTDAAIAAFRAGYGPIAADVNAWESLALVRLAALAETRHGDPHEARQLCELTRSSGTGGTR